MTALLERLPRGTAAEVDRRLFPLEDVYAHDPEAWINAQLHEDLWSKQQRIVRAVDEHRYVAVPSAHDTGKSFTGSRLACWWIETRVDPFVVSTAPTQAQVNAILWREIRKAHKKGDLRGRVTLKAEWYLGHDELVAFGRKPADYVDAEQAMQAFQGIHAENVLIIIDEACGVPRWLFDAVDSLATNENARVVAIGNPDDPASHFAEICQPGSGWHVEQISAFDTPAFTGEPVSERLLRLLVSRRWVEERAERWGEDSPLYTSKVLGRFPDISDDTMFPPAILRKAFDETDLDGTRKALERGGYGLDVARYGDDETAMYRNRGGMIRRAFAHSKRDTVQTSDRAAVELAGHGAANIPAVVDAIGLGAGVYDQLRARGFRVLEFNPTEKAHDDERFANRLSELYWTLREMCEAGEADLDPEDDDLRAQLGKLKWKLDGRGRILVESKEDMRRRGVKSPDRAEACVMALSAPVTPFETPERPPAGETLTDDLLDRPL